MIFKQSFQGLDFTFYMPGLPLSDFVHCFIEISGKPVQRTIRNFPVLKSEITFNLSGSPLRGESGKSGNSIYCNYSIFRGAMSAWQDMYLPEFIHLIGVSFKPEVLYSLFNIAPYELNDQFIESSLFIKEIDGVWYQLIEAKSTRKCFEILYCWMMGKIRRSNYTENNLAGWIKEQCIIKPDIMINQLEKQSGYSRKHLFTEFKKYSGVSIKHFQELLRLQNIMRELQSKQVNDLASLAYKYHFYDQAHLINTFKKLTGMTPTQLNEIYLPQQTVEQKGYNLSYSGKD